MNQSLKVWFNQVIFFPTTKQLGFNEILFQEVMLGGEKTIDPKNTEEVVKFELDMKGSLKIEINSIFNEYQN